MEPDVSVFGMRGGVANPQLPPESHTETAALLKGWHDLDRRAANAVQNGLRKNSQLQVTTPSLAALHRLDAVAGSRGLTGFVPRPGDFL
jgi:hypothetical protein